MPQESSIKPLLIATASFVGGVAAGFLFAPESGPRNRKWLSHQAADLSRWANKQRKRASRKSEQEFHKLHQNFHRGLKSSVPDFYEATKHIALNERDLI